MENFINQLEEHLKTSDEIDLIEDLINGVISGQHILTFESERLSAIEALDHLKTCHIFQMYREDIELKNIFFSELAHLKDTWSCYADLPDRQVYTKTEQGLNHMSVFYRFKVPTNMFFPLALLSEVDLFKEWIPSVLKSEILENKSDFRKIVQVQR